MTSSRELTKGLHARRRRRAGALALAALLVCAATAARAGGTNALSEASFEDLLRHVQRYATTPEMKAAKAAARAEFTARGTNALDWLMARIHIQNDTLGALAFSLTHSLGTNAAPALLRALEAPSPAARKQAAYLLGFVATPQHAPAVMALLEDDAAAGAAARTLGKWKYAAALPRIAPLLGDARERRRVTAANALHDLGDPRAVTPLLAALGDRAFTVRRAARRALAALGRPAEKALLKALPGAAAPWRGEVVGALGDMRSRRAIRPLKRLLRDPDSQTRLAASRALLAIDAAAAAPWVRAAGGDPDALTLQAP